MKLSVKGLRANANMSQEDVAKKLGLSKQGYRNKEIGVNDFKWEEILKLAKLFKVPLDAFK